MLVLGWLRCTNRVVLLFQPLSRLHIFPHSQDFYGLHHVSMTTEISDVILIQAYTSHNECSKSMCIQRHSNVIVPISERKRAKASAASPCTWGQSYCAYIRAYTSHGKRSESACVESEVRRHDCQHRRRHWRSYDTCTSVWVILMLWWVRTWVGRLVRVRNFKPHPPTPAT